jgi:hypothetical protein
MTQRTVEQIRFLVFVAGTVGLSTAMGFAPTLWTSF